VKLDLSLKESVRILRLFEERAPIIFGIKREELS
jgi:hypothetical protein